MSSSFDAESSTLTPDTYRLPPLLLSVGIVMARQQIGSDSRPLPHLCCSPYLSHHNHIGDLTRIPPLYFFSCSAPVSPEGFFSQLRPMELERGERRIGRALLLRSPGEKIVYPAAPPVAPSMGRSRRGIPSSSSPPPPPTPPTAGLTPPPSRLTSLSFPPTPQRQIISGSPSDRWWLLHSPPPPPQVRIFVSGVHHRHCLVVSLCVGPYFIPTPPR